MAGLLGNYLVCDIRVMHGFHQYKSHPLAFTALPSVTEVHPSLDSATVYVPLTKNMALNPEITLFCQGYCLNQGSAITYLNFSLLSIRFTL